MAEMAKVIRLVRSGSSYQFEIDGVEFPWYVREHIQVDIARTDVPSITVQIIADRVEVIDEPTLTGPVEASQSPVPVKRPIGATS